jgi:hypothetical protein
MLREVDDYRTFLESPEGIELAEHILKIAA